MFPELSLATSIKVLTPVSCYDMASFNYRGKEAKDVGLTCRCHLINIMPDSIFYNSIGMGMTQFFCCFCFSFVVVVVVVVVVFSLGVVITVLLSIEEMDSVLSL